MTTTRQLTPEQHRVLREHGTERPGSSPLNYEKAPRRVPMRRLRRRAIRCLDQVRQRHGWPSFL
jgi:peptide-methionine (R)-S-oxide reductase